MNYTVIISFINNQDLVLNDISADTFDVILRWIKANEKNPYDTITLKDSIVYRHGIIKIEWKNNDAS